MESTTQNKIDMQDLDQDMDTSKDLIILARIGEIVLKGLNRRSFEEKLFRNLLYALKEEGQFKISQSHSRIWIEPLKETKKVFSQSIDKVIEKVVQVFGIVSASPVRRLEKDMDILKEASLQWVEEIFQTSDPKTFKVESRRGDKKFPLDSQALSAFLGHEILKHFPALSVQVKQPDFILYVEVRDFIYIYSQKISGFRGLPVGTSGKGMLLLSGGIDSPVAGFLMASRGMSLNAVYFHSHPYTSEEAKNKVIHLGKILSNYVGKMKLFIVNFTQIQLDIYEKAPAEMMTVVMRRVMMKIAEKIALKEKCQALITGESLGQVASQTIEALTLTNQASALPVLRPLIGLDKDYVIEVARKIKTFETSILPYEDCCTVFVAKHPRLKPTAKDLIFAEKALNIEELVEQGLLDIEEISIDSTEQEVNPLADT